MKFKYIILVFLTIFSAHAHLVHINSIKEVITYLDSNKNVMVVFDIDNTLLHPKTDLGSDQWFCNELQNHVAQGLDHTRALAHVLPLYFHINHNIELVTTEENLPEIVSIIQKKCAHVYCLTTRSLDLVEKTIEQLEKNNLHFKSTIQEFFLPLPHTCFYKSNILFCGKNDKGTVLSTFLDTINYQPDSIIFVDDKESHLHCVLEAAQKRDIEYIGLRYAGCDERVKSFNRELTEQELQLFLSNHPLASY